MKAQILLLSFIISLFACTAPRPAYYLPPSSTLSEANQESYLTESLFQNENKTLSESDIQKILDSKIQFADSLRIAIFNYSALSGSRYYSQVYYYNSEEQLKLQQDNIETITEKLNPIDNVTKVILLPQLVTGPKPDIFQLREAAVRLQADLLVVFTTFSDTYYNYKAFAKDEVKAFATCESILMDVRTGILPFTQIASQDVLLKKEKTDLNNEDLRRRAQAQAIQQALDKISIGLQDFIQKLD